MSNIFSKDSTFQPTNTPTLHTQRLVLRKFTEADIPALLQIHQDPEVNRFLPWFPLTTLEQAQQFYQERYAPVYAQAQGYAYAICKDCKEADQQPIGYINVSMDEAHDLGYGLAKAYWGQGIVTEAAQAVVEQVKADGLPFLTATHDVNNPGSGRVMQKVGMRYCYSYEEQWQPKDFPVIFRMYQLNLHCPEDFVFKKYWDVSTKRFVEEL